MSLLWAHRIDLGNARKEAGRLGAFLSHHDFFRERDVVALLRDCPNLTVLAGALGRGMIVADAFKYEFGIEGVVSADLVLRNRSRDAVVFVEFEGGEQNSIFAARGTRQLRGWSRQVEHATGQIVDWSWALSNANSSELLRHNLGVSVVEAQFLIVCGRDRSLDSDLFRSRFAFRRSRLNIGGSSVVFLTYDGFLQEIRHALTEIGVEGA